jgi:hypothetical protein
MAFRRHLIGSLAAAAILAPSLVSADAPAAKWYDKLSVSGYAASDYEFWLNQPSAVPSKATVPGRVFDGKANVFDYTGELTLAYADNGSGTGATVDLLFGAVGAAVNGAGLTATAGITPTLGQAYISQTLGKFTLDLGKFATPVGYETWNPTANANWSRSLTYSLEPFFQTGAKLDFAGPAGISANLWVDDGNSIDPNSNANVDNGKGWGVALGYTGMKNLALNAQFYSSDANLYGSTNGFANLPNFDNNDMIDVNAAYTLNDSLSFAAEYLYSTMLDGVGSGPWNPTFPYSPKVNAFALYAMYNTPIKGLSVNGRWEQVNSPDQGQTVPWKGTINGHNVGLADLTVDSYTATIKYAMGPVTDILEYRADAANGYDFATSSTAGASKSQVDSTVTVAVTYGF